VKLSCLITGLAAFQNPSFLLLRQIHMSALAEATGIPRTEQCWPRTDEIHSKALIIKAAIRQEKSRVSRGPKVLDERLAPANSLLLCAAVGIPVPLELGGMFCLHLDPPSGAQKVHWLGLLKEVCGEMEAPPGKLKSAAQTCSSLSPIFLRSENNSVAQQAIDMQLTPAVHWFWRANSMQERETKHHLCLSRSNR
jgi:hypothetical protein